MKMYILVDLPSANLHEDLELVQCVVEPVFDQVPAGGGEVGVPARQGGVH